MVEVRHGRVSEGASEVLRGGQRRTLCPQQRSPLSWPGEGGQVEDYARRGDEVEQLVDLASIGWKSPLDRRLRSRMATRPFQFTDMEEKHTRKSELLLLMTRFAPS